MLSSKEPARAKLHGALAGSPTASFWKPGHEGPLSKATMENKVLHAHKHPAGISVSYRGTMVL